MHDTAGPAFPSSISCWEWIRVSKEEASDPVLCYFLPSLTWLTWGPARGIFALLLHPQAHPVLSSFSTAHFLSPWPFSWSFLTFRRKGFFFHHILSFPPWQKHAHGIHKMTPTCSCRNMKLLVLTETSGFLFALYILLLVNTNASVCLIPLNI